MADYRVILLDADDYGKWNVFVDESPEGCIFNKTWYLEAAGAHFRILAAHDVTGDIVGGIVLPFGVDGKIAMMPAFTQTLGVLLAPFPTGKYVRRLSRESDITAALADNIPDCKYFDCYFHYNFTNWLPFHWQGYHQTTRYTYVLDYAGGIEAVKKGMSQTLRNTIRKAEKSGFTARTDLNPEDGFALVRSTLEQRSPNSALPLERYVKLNDALQERRAATFFGAFDKDGALQAVSYIVHDSRAAYYLLAGRNVEEEHSPAGAFVLWEAIKYFADKAGRFDFEGSMIQGVERFFRSFGGRQMPYFNISKTTGKFRRLVENFRKSL